MEHLPPVGWADVATKTDLHALELRLEGLEARMDHRFEQIDLRFDGFGHQLDSLANKLRAEFQRDLRGTMLAVITANAAIVAVVAALTSLF